MEYGVNVSNKFAFLSGDEDNDPEEVIAKAQSASKEKPSVLKKEVKKPAVVEKKVTIAAVNSVNKENVDHRRPPRRDGPPRNGPGFERKNVRGPPPRKTDENGDPVFEEARPPRQFNNNRPPRFNNNNNDNNTESFNNNNRGPPRRFRNDGPRPQRQENFGDSTDENNQNHQVGENRQPYNGGGASAGGRYRRNGPPRADRTSGSDKTGVRSVPKKDGFGKGNWGTEQDELAAGTDAAATNPDATLNQSANETTTVAEHTEQVDGHADDEKSEEAEPEPVRALTLEEFKAQHKSEQPKFNTRKPGEGAEKKIYQKLKPLKPADGKKNAAKEAEEVQIKREPREKALNIEVSFNGAQRNRGGPRYREDRGGYGREDRGGYAREDRGGYGDEPRGGGFRGDDRRGGDRRPPGGGAGGGNFRAGPSGSGGVRRGPANSSQFNLTPESFPALGAH